MHQKPMHVGVLIEVISQLDEDIEKIMNACLEWFLFTYCYNTFDFIAALQVRAPFSSHASKLNFEFFGVICQFKILVTF
jgi:uncharacterized membrane protein (DUF373 family)